MRLSLTVDLEIPVVERLVLLQEDLEEPFHHLGAQVEWMAPERLRLNLLVVPDADASLVLRWREALRTIAGSSGPFSLSTVGASFRPNEDVARYVVIGHEAGADAARALSERAAVALRGLGGTPAAGEWTPWVALGRMKTPASAPLLGGVLRPYGETPFGDTQVRELSLYRSELVRGKASVQQVERFVLGRG